MYTEDCLFSPRISYGVEDEGNAQFLRICPNCGRFVKADDSIRTRWIDGQIENAPNATCSKCGRVSMPFEGWF